MFQFHQGRTSNNCLPQQFTQRIYLVTSQHVIQNVCILAGSLFYIAQQKHLLCKISCESSLCKIGPRSLCKGLKKPFPATDNVTTCIRLTHRPYHPPTALCMLFTSCLLIATQCTYVLNNNNNGHLYCAGICQVWRSWRMNIITHVIGPSYIITRSISTPWGVCSPCCQMCSATSLIKHNYHLCPQRSPFILLGEEKQLQLSVLLRDTRTTVVVRIRTHILTTRPSEHKSDALNHLAMAPHISHKPDSCGELSSYTYMYTCNTQTLKRSGALQDFPNKTFIIWWCNHLVLILLLCSFHTWLTSSLPVCLCL